MRMTIILMMMFAVCAVTNITIAGAQDKKSRGKTDTYQKLESQQPNDITAALEQIRKDRNPAGVRALTNRIHDGLPPKLLLLAVDALVAINDNLSAKTIMELSSHRSEAVRKKVAMSMPTLRSPKTMKVLVEMLDDHEPEVRSQAAFAIGELKPQSAMKELITAAARGNIEASEIVGKQVRSERVPSLIEMLDEKTVYALTPLFRELVARTNIPNHHKLAVVARLEELSTTDSKRLLGILAPNLPTGSVAKQGAVKPSNKKADTKLTGKVENEKIVVIPPVVTKKEER